MKILPFQFYNWFRKAFFTLLIIFLSIAGNGQKYSISVSFNLNNFIIEKDISFNYIKYSRNNDIRYFLPIGYPELPYISYYVLLPHNARIKSILITDSKIETIKGLYNIIPKSIEDTDNKKVFNEKLKFKSIDEIYSSDGYLPSSNEIARYDSAQLYAGFQISKIFICPFKYSPKTRQLLLYTKLFLDVYYQIDEKPLNLELSPEKIKLSRDFIRNIVINKEGIEKIVPLEVKMDYSKIQIFKETEENIKRNNKLDTASFKPIKPVEPFYIRKLK